MSGTRGEMLLLARRRRGLDLRAVEMLSCVSISTISRAEHDHETTWTVMARLAKALELDLNELARVELAQEGR